jgi:hypothetical protein
VGISDEDLARVGEPYFQAGSSYDRRQGGTGLGLSIVKGLVRLHGGDISIRSRVGEGTRVSVSLSLDCERVRPAKNRSVRAPADVTRYWATHLPNSVAAQHAVAVTGREDAAAPFDIWAKKSA